MVVSIPKWKPRAGRIGHAAWAEAIEDRMIPRTSSTTGPNPSYYNTRFNETYNKPFWATSAPNAIA